MFFQNIRGALFIFHCHDPDHHIPPLPLSIHLNNNTAHLPFQHSFPRRSIFLHARLSALHRRYFPAPHGLAAAPFPAVCTDEHIYYIVIIIMSRTKQRRSDARRPNGIPQSHYRTRAVSCQEQNKKHLHRTRRAVSRFGGAALRVRDMLFYGGNCLIPLARAQATTSSA